MKWLRGHKLVLGLLALVVVLVVVRLMLPTWVQDYVNRRLNELPDYTGRIGAVEMSLWRGAYRIRDIHISKRNGKVPVPLFFGPRMDLAVDWRALFHGAFVGKIQLERPQLNFVNWPTKAQTQTGFNQPWTEKVKQLFPLRIDRFEVHQGEVHYRDFHRTQR